MADFKGVRGHVDGDGDYVVKLIDIVGDIRQFEEQVTGSGDAVSGSVVLQMLVRHYEAKTLELRMLMSDPRIEGLDNVRVQCTASAESDGPTVTL